MRLALATAVLLAALTVAAPAGSHPLPQAPNCPVFPETNVWNKPVNKLPLRPDSRTLVNSIGANLRLHADFGRALERRPDRDSDHGRRLERPGLVGGLRVPGRERSRPLSDSRRRRH